MITILALLILHLINLPLSNFRFDRKWFWYYCDGFLKAGYPPVAGPTASKLCGE